MPKTREDKLKELGLETFDREIENLGSRSRALMAGLAAVVAEATKPKAKRKSPTTYQDRQKGQEVYDLLREQAPSALAYKPLQDRTLGQLGKALRDASITNQHVINLSRWLQSKPFEWRDNKPTWGEFVKKAIDWIAQSEEWIRKTRPQDVGTDLDALRGRAGGL